ncbi:cdk-activating kinase assembly factor mat1 [Nannochloropsis gaditana]|uniref:Cdk-activating kinase assembly factor mat1 n=1 Tax=Nannochloropsis gaditana TaxID=72520 RepID=W7T9Z1_9STRA|nr:cdk-activating kinase assembly factor mat1 [Nannochloropsis gaditana]
MYSYKVDAGGSCFVRPFPPSLPHSLLFLFPLPSCDTCIQREFARKTRGGFRCPACARLGKDREVLRQSLETKSREQLMVELDTKWRERVLEVYGKKEEDFGGNEDAYNDYIEEREDLIYTLANRLFIDENEVREAEIRLEKERKTNEVAVARYRARREEDRRRSARAVESFEQEWAEQVRRAHEQEKRELEKLREFRLQIQQKNLGERDQVTVELVGRGGGGRADGEEEEEDEDVARALGREGGRGGGLEGGGAGMSGASAFCTNLRVLVGPPPRIVVVEGGRETGGEGGKEGIAKASGWPLSLRYKRCWEEAIASLFLGSGETRGRLGRTFYR